MLGKRTLHVTLYTICTPTVSVPFSCNVVSTDLGRAYASSHAAEAYGYMIKSALKLSDAASFSMEYLSRVGVRQGGHAMIVLGSIGIGTPSEI